MEKCDNDIVVQLLFNKIEKSVIVEKLFIKPFVK